MWTGIIVLAAGWAFALHRLLTTREQHARDAAALDAMDAMAEEMAVDDLAYQPVKDAVKKSRASFDEARQTLWWVVGAVPVPWCMMVAVAVLS